MQHTTLKGKKNMRPKLSEIRVGELLIMDREDNDMHRWLLGINSVLFPTSLKCKTIRNGTWVNCIATGRLADDGSGRLNISITFPDATAFTVKGSRSSFLPSKYTTALESYRKATGEEKHRKGA